MKLFIVLLLLVLVISCTQTEVVEEENTEQEELQNEDDDEVNSEKMLNEEVGEKKEKIQIPGFPVEENEGEAEVVRCVDSDEGINAREKGTVELIDSNGDLFKTFDDECSNNVKVVEYFCDENVNQLFRTNLIFCDKKGDGFKCLDGACVKEDDSAIECFTGKDCGELEFEYSCKIGAQLGQVHYVYEKPKSFMCNNDNKCIRQFGKETRKETCAHGCLDGVCTPDPEKNCESDDDCPDTKVIGFDCSQNRWMRTYFETYVCDKPGTVNSACVKNLSNITNIECSKDCGGEVVDCDGDLCPVESCDSFYN